MSENLKNFKEKIDFDTYRSSNCSKKEEMSKKDAEKMLEALQQKEKELQEKLQKKKVKGQKIKILKDW